MCRLDHRYYGDLCFRFATARQQRHADAYEGQGPRHQGRADANEAMAVTSSDSRSK